MTQFLLYFDFFKYSSIFVLVLTFRSKVAEKNIIKFYNQNFIDLRLIIIVHIIIK